MANPCTSSLTIGLRVEVGEKASAYLRNAAADLTRSIVDSIRKVDPMAKVIVMGDLNDDPNNEN